MMDAIDMYNVTSTDTIRYPMLEQVYNVVAKYGWMLPAITGIPGNVLVFFVMTLKHNRTLSPSIYMTAMALSDNLVLFQCTMFFLTIMLGVGDIKTGREHM